MTCGDDVRRRWAGEDEVRLLSVYLGQHRQVATCGADGGVGRYYNVTLQQARHYMRQPAAQDKADTLPPSAADSSAGLATDTSHEAAESASGANGQAAGGRKGDGDEDEDFARLMAEAEEGEGRELAAGDARAQQS